MAARRRRRRPPARTRPAPELVALGLVAVLYALALGIGPAIIAGASAPTIVPTPPPPASQTTPSPSASANPLRGEIAAILEVNKRLIIERTELREILRRKPVRGSEIAFALRQLPSILAPANERVGRLAAQPAAREIGARLEFLYASANDSIERASDLALGSDAEYEDAAGEIVALFADLPSINRDLRELGGLTTPAPSSAPPSSSASASESIPPASADPNELLRDPGFETVTGAWSLRTTSDTRPAVLSGPPLGSLAGRSIRIEVPQTRSLADVAIGQGPISLHGGSSYVVSVWIRAAEPRSAELRVVGPIEETYGIAVFDIGEDAAKISFEFPARLDQPNATFWIDLGGPLAGTVELDNASFVKKPVRASASP